jgi:general secretion pathway protein G
MLDKGLIMNRTVGRRRRGAGFTIVEILVVVIIVAALATMIVPQFFGKIGKSRQAVARQKVIEIEKAIEMFAAEYDRLPENLDEMVTRPEDISEDKWSAPTLRAKDLLDPWERKFEYKQPGDHGTYDVFSLGKDGQVGGEKDDADNNNWN